MRALTETHAGHHRDDEHGSMFKSITRWMSAMSETIWLCITFILFIVMGPFSVIAVLYGLWALGSAENRERMSEPVSC